MLENPDGESIPLSSGIKASIIVVLPVSDLCAVGSITETFERQGDGIR